ncbi:MAG: LapA family protein [Actinomycetes bacterium]
MSVSPSPQSPEPGANAHRVPRTPSGPQAGHPASSTRSGTPAGVPGPYEHKTSWTAYIKPVLWILLLLYIVLFVFLNRSAIEINFLFFTAQVPLIFVLVGVGLIGALLACAVVLWVRRRDTKKAAAAAKNASVKGDSV